MKVGFLEVSCEQAKPSSFRDGYNSSLQCSYRLASSNSWIATWFGDWRETDNSSYWLRRWLMRWWFCEMLENFSTSEAMQATTLLIAPIAPRISAKTTILGKFFITEGDHKFKQRWIEQSNHFKNLLTKFSQSKIACVDGILVDWNS